MNWNRQVEDTMKNWTDMQQKTWNTFFSSMEGLTKSQETRAWEATLSMGENLLKEMFKAQSDWMSAWVDGMAKMEGLPPQALESARQFQEMSAQWNKTQADLLGNWFNFLRKMAPARPADAWTEMPQSMFKTWQDTTTAIMDAQTKWLRTWVDQARKPSDE